MNLQVITPYDFGAVGDGKHDDTAAIRSAVSAASEKGGTVFFPEGTYRTDVITVPAGICLKADPVWKYRDPGKCVLVPLNDEQECVLEVSDAIGTTVYGLSIDGLGMGEKMHGISMTHDRHITPSEHTLRFDTIKVANFTGNGMNMEGAWCMSVRHSYFNNNGGFGLYLDGFDLFVHDNWFSFNGIAGFGGYTWNSSVNFTSNRIEWNKVCGLMLCGSMHYNITGNYFDRSFGPAIIIKPGKNYHKRMYLEHTVMPHAITITGNNILRSGKTAEPGSDDDCHIYMENASAISIVGNTFHVWKDDGPHGRVSPWYGIIYKSCAHSVIANNTMLPGAKKQLFVDKGGHGPQMLVHDNVGDVIPEAAQNSQDPFTPPHFMVEGKDEWYTKVLNNETHYAPLEDE